MKFVIPTQVAALFFALGFFLSSSHALDSVVNGFTQWLESKSHMSHQLSADIKRELLPSSHQDHRRCVSELALDLYHGFCSAYQNVALNNDQDSVITQKNTDRDMYHLQASNTMIEQMLAHKKRMYHGTIYDAVSAMDEEKVFSYIKTLTNLEKTDIDPRFTYPEIAQALYDISEDEYDGKWVSPLYFGSTVNGDNQVTAGRNLFSVENKKIYASFEIPGGGVDKVLEKWYRYGDEEPVIYEVVAIDPSKEFNYVWASPKDEAWKSGDYLVEIYDVKDFSAISGGHFSISNPEEEQTSESLSIQ